MADGLEAALDAPQGEGDAGVEIDAEVLAMPAEEIVARAHMLDNEVGESVFLP
jgi:hypothetical protein